MNSLTTSSRVGRTAFTSLLLAGLASATTAQTGQCKLSLDMDLYVPGDTSIVTLEADPGLVPFLFVSLRPDAVDTSPYGGRRFAPMPASGVSILKTATVTCDVPNKYLQAVLFHPITRRPVCVSNEVYLDIKREGFCEPMECAPCDGKVDRLTLQYTGQTPLDIEVYSKNDPQPVFAGEVSPGEVFTLVGMDKKGTLGTSIEIFAEGSRWAEFHTSCSVPIGPGTTSGPFRVLAGSSRNGGDLCPLRDPGGSEPPPTGDLCDAGRARCLTLAYRGDDCDASSHAQGDAVSCAGTPDFLTEVIIMVTDRRGRDVFFHDVVSLDQPFHLDGSFTRSGKVAPTTVVEIFDLDGNLLQEVSFHTSCSQPLGLGDRFGAVELVGYNDCATGR